FISTVLNQSMSTKRLHFRQPGAFTPRLTWANSRAIGNFSQSFNLFLRIGGKMRFSSRDRTLSANARSIVTSRVLRDLGARSGPEYPRPGTTAQICTDRGAVSAEGSPVPPPRARHDVYFRDRGPLISAAGFSDCLPYVSRHRREARGNSHQPK